MDSISDIIPIGVATPGVLIGIFVWLVFTGRLVPRSSVSELLRVVREQRDDAQHEGRDWKEAHRISEEARQVQSGQIDELAHTGATTLAVLEALRTTHQLQTGPAATGGGEQ